MDLSVGFLVKYLKSRRMSELLYGHVGGIMCGVGAVDGKC